MGIGGIGIPTISPMIGVLPSTVPSSFATTSQSSVAAGQFGAANGRLDQLIQLIDTFSPADVLMGLLMANTTYQQSSATVSVSAGAIEMQLASQISASGMSSYTAANSASAATGSQLNVQG